VGSSREWTSQTTWLYARRYYLVRRATLILAAVCSLCTCTERASEIEQRLNDGTAALFRYFPDSCSWIVAAPTGDDLLRNLKKKGLVSTWMMRARYSHDSCTIPHDFDLAVSSVKFHFWPASQAIPSRHPSSQALFGNACRLRQACYRP
jgi:hypothetical protein